VEAIDGNPDEAGWVDGSHTAAQDLLQAGAKVLDVGIQ
jgi:hypothetical protein